MNKKVENIIAELNKFDELSPYDYDQIIYVAQKSREIKRITIFNAAKAGDQIKFFYGPEIISATIIGFKYHPDMFKVLANGMTHFVNVENVVDWVKYK